MMLISGVLRKTFFFWGGETRVCGPFSKFNQSYNISEHDLIWERRTGKSIKEDKLFKSENFANFGPQTSMNICLRILPIFVSKHT